MARVWNNQGGAHLQNQDYSITEKSTCLVQNKKGGHKNPNNSRNYRDEIELYTGIRKKHT